MRVAALTAILASLPGCAGWDAWEPRIVRYVCWATAEGPYGRIDAHAFLSPDGSRATYSAVWTAEAADGRLSLHMAWRDGLVAPPPATRLRVALAIPAGPRSWSRLEIHRDGDAGVRMHSTSYFSPPWRWFETMRWGRFTALMSGAEALDFRLVRRDGTIVTEALLPRTILSAPSEAVAAVRLRLDTDLADHANRCSPDHDPPLFIA